jgi:hypothetical protein
MIMPRLAFEEPKGGPRAKAAPPADQQAPPPHQPEPTGEDAQPEFEWLRPQRKPGAHRADDQGDGFQQTEPPSQEAGPAQLGWHAEWANPSMGRTDSPGQQLEAPEPRSDSPEGREEPQAGQPADPSATQIVPQVEAPSAEPSEDTQPGVDPFAALTELPGQQVARAEPEPQTESAGRPAEPAPPAQLSGWSLLGQGGLQAQPAKSGWQVEWAAPAPPQVEPAEPSVGWGELWPESSEPQASGFAPLAQLGGLPVRRPGRNGTPAKAAKSPIKWPEASTPVEWPTAQPTELSSESLRFQPVEWPDTPEDESPEGARQLSELFVVEPEEDRPGRHRRAAGRDAVVVVLKAATVAVAIALLGAVVLLATAGEAEPPKAKTPSVPEIATSHEPSAGPVARPTDVSAIVAPEVRSQTAQIVPPPPASSSAPSSPSVPASQSSSAPNQSQFVRIGDRCDTRGARAFTERFEPVVCDNSRQSGELVWRRMFR